MGVQWHTNRHVTVSCFDKGFKWFARNLAWSWQPIAFTEF